MIQTSRGWGMRKQDDSEGVIPHYEDDICNLCDVEKVYWHKCLICVVCDNRDDGEATWFQDFAEENTS